MGVFARKDKNSYPTKTKFNFLKVYSYLLQQPGYQVSIALPFLVTRGGLCNQIHATVSM